MVDSEAAIAPQPATSAIQWKVALSVAAPVALWFVPLSLSSPKRSKPS
jgi:hypothetical protein